MGVASYADKVARSLWVIFVQKKEHISMFPTGLELITDKLVSEAIQNSLHALIYVDKRWLESILFPRTKD